jgi:hypothetical protein
MGMHGGDAPELIKGCGRIPDGLKFELDIKSKFFLKNEIPRNPEIRVSFG